jgi:hypothetical protein
MQIDLEQWAPCSFARHPGVGRDDEQKHGKASAVGRVFQGDKKTNADFSARCSINFA